MNEIKINGHHYRSLSANSDMSLAQPGDLVMTVGDPFIYKVSSITEKVASLDPWHGTGHRSVRTVSRTNARLVRVEKFDPPKPVVETVYLNWYGGDGFVNATKEGADRGAGPARKACIAITSIDGVVTGVSLAPTQAAWARVQYAPPMPPPWPSASKPT